MKLGLIARMDRTGLGQGQTLRLARLLKPEHIMLIDSTPFNGNQQFPGWYDGFNITHITGFPNDYEVSQFLGGLDVVMSCETFYNNNFTRIARQMGVKTILVANPEFFDWFKPEFAAVPLPDRVLVPSYWMLETMHAQFNAVYLPTPIFDDEFGEVRTVNLARSGQRKYLFMNGKTAVHDRNGLESLYEALPLSIGDYTITIKAQHDVKRHPDPRLIYDFSNPINQSELYKGFDALIQPRRYGGQTLSMCEALLCALPVVMTDIEPNNLTLPEEWLVSAEKTGEFMTRRMIDIYSAHPYALANTLDNLELNHKAKDHALSLGKQYEVETLRSQYMEIMKW